MKNSFFQLAKNLVTPTFFEPSTTKLKKVKIFFVNPVGNFGTIGKFMKFGETFVRALFENSTDLCDVSIFLDHDFFEINFYIGFQFLSF